MDIGSVINSNVNTYLKQNLYTAIPAVVVTVANFGEQQLVNVKPLISKVYADKTVLEPAVIMNVPVVFPSSGGGIISFPVAEGDTVLVIYSMRSLEEWLEGDGSEVTPDDIRHFNRSDAIAIPGLYTKSSNLKPNTTDVEIKFKNMSMKMQPNDNIVTTNGVSTITQSPNGDVSINANSKIILNAGSDIDIIAAGNVNVTGSTINLN